MTEKAVSVTKFSWRKHFFFFLVSLGGVRLSPLGKSATIWPIVPAPENRWWMWSSRWNENWQGKPKNSEKTFPSDTLSTINPTWFDLDSNSGRRGGTPVTNRLCYGMVWNILNVPTNFMRDILSWRKVRPWQHAELSTYTTYFVARLTV
jgi:hypothetical protein